MSIPGLDYFTVEMERRKSYNTYSSLLSLSWSMVQRWYSFAKFFLKPWLPIQSKTRPENDIHMVECQLVYNARFYWHICDVTKLWKWTSFPFRIVEDTIGVINANLRLGFGGIIVNDMAKMLELHRDCYVLL